jgi:hypothetical protein
LEQQSVEKLIQPTKSRRSSNFDGSSSKLLQGQGNKGKLPAISEASDHTQINSNESRASGQYVMVE